MAPPATAALALLGVWILVTLWATTTAAGGQARADDRFGLEEQSEQSLEEPSFSTADD
ncbi:hypothetical protein Natpe_0583 [Natrinema pellirubrum DSM 15624]|uniref:Uncharacterized protein n=1 Tax=Natrinema pellirubrum (strain DSM 15624 / CIP 106293 / JCM 10476 / NCIMB 786 / 157) TaxID=797303 RepID=L0JGS6_NATP1|nr:hypothetical protein [Natrinema pellirubrum]AGB30509.1 hypothetical protein Natpe_0583 [Natrinema pellirubrum DSM 15624]